MTKEIPEEPDFTESPEDDKTRRQRTKKIGQRLRDMYQEVTQEDVPDDFLKLLEEADRSRSEKDGA